MRPSELGLAHSSLFALTEIAVVGLRPDGTILSGVTRASVLALLSHHHSPPRSPGCPRKYASSPSSIRRRCRSSFPRWLRAHFGKSSCVAQRPSSSPLCAWGGSTRARARALSRKWRWWRSCCPWRVGQDASRRRSRCVSWIFRRDLSSGRGGASRAEPLMQVDCAGPLSPFH